MYIKISFHHTNIVIQVNITNQITEMKGVDFIASLREWMDSLKNSPICKSTLYKKLEVKQTLKQLLSCRLYLNSCSLLISFSFL